MSSIRWSAEVEFLARISRDQLDEYAAGAQMAYYNSDDLVLRLTRALDADDYAAAMAEAQAWVAALAITGRAGRDGVSGPVRFTVESEFVHRWAVGTKEAAEKLGISTTRLRQLEHADPAFPKPAAEVAGGRVYRKDEVETYAHEREPGQPGRPRKAAPDA